MAELIGVGLSVLIAIKLGEKDFKTANTIFTSACILIVLSGFVLGGTFFIFAESILRLMGADETMIILGAQYFKVYALAAPFNLIMFAVDNYLRICGKIKYSMLTNIAVSGIIIIELLMLGVFGWGIWVAALASCLGMGIGTLSCLIPFLTGKTQLHFVKPQITRKVVGTMQPAVGYNYGAGNHERVKKLLECTLECALISFALMGLFIILGREALATLFIRTEDQAIIELTVHAMMLFMASFAFRWLSLATQSIQPIQLCNHHFHRNGICLSNSGFIKFRNVWVYQQSGYKKRKNGGILMKRIRMLVAVCLVLAVSLLGATSVFAQDTSNWDKNAGIWDTNPGNSRGPRTLEPGTPSNVVSTAGGPVIISQPQDVHFTIPQPANMTIVVQNPETCDFQWQWQMKSEGQADEWYDFIGPGSQRATLENKVTSPLLDGMVVRCVVTSKSDAAKVTVSSPATYLLDGDSPDYYASLGDQIVLMGQTIDLTGGGQASLSADGKTLTLDNAKVTYSSDYNTFTSGVGLDYVATADDDANAVSIQLIGENSLVADTEKTYTDTDQVKKSFAGLYFHGIYKNSSDRMTLNIGGTGSLLLDSPRQTSGLFDYYGIYTESFVKIIDTARIIIDNKFIGVIAADLAMAENTALTVSAQLNALELLPSHNALASLDIKSGALLDTKAKMGTVIALKGDGQLTAEGATIKLDGTMTAADQPPNQDQIVVAGVTTYRSQTAAAGAGNVTLKNCSLTTSLSTNHEQVLFQQGLRVSGDLVIDGGTVTVNSKILDGSVNSSGVIGIQGNSILLKNNAETDIQVDGNNMAIGCIATDQLTIADAGLNALIDNSAGKFSATDTEALGIGAQHMEISMSSGQKKVHAQILGYDNGLPLVNFLDSSDTRQDYDPNYQPDRLTLGDKAGFVLPTATEAVINQASLEAHQVLGQPLKKYSIYEAVYNKNDTSKGAQAVTIAATTAGTVSYSSQIQNIGWQQAATNGAISGTTGQGLRLEAITINLDGFAEAGSIEYKSHIQNKGWEPGFKSAGQISGSVGEGLRLEAIEIQLTGAMAEKYDVYYQVHAKNFGWLNWAKNGQPAGTEGQSLRLEAIRIQIVPKGTVVNSEGTNPKAYITLADL